MRNCKTGKHEYVHSNDKTKIFVPWEEYNTKYGFCTKCGRCIKGSLTKPKVF